MYTSRNIYSFIYIINLFSNNIIILFYNSSHKELERNAEQKEILIPIKLDFDIGTHKLRDTFTWNLNGNRNLNLSFISFIENL